MERTAETTKIHMHLIAAMVNYLLSKGYKVSADHIGYPNGKPSEYMGITPDIYAKKGNEEIYIEAETCDSLNCTETKIQWITLSSNPNVSFSVIVPEKCVSEAKKLTKEWGIKVKSFYSMTV